VLNKRSLIPVTDDQELHKALNIYQPGYDMIPMNNTLHLSHLVRIKDKSTPSNRPSEDKARLSLFIKGGQLRGVVSVVYESSAGSIDVYQCIH
jgi:hypothetical protein